MQPGLAEEWWLRVRDQPAESEDRLAAAHILANSLLLAPSVFEASTRRRSRCSASCSTCSDGLGPEHPSTLDTTGNFAASLRGQGKHAEAEEMQRELLDVRRRVLGPEHPNTLTSMNNLALSLSDQGKHAAAEQMERELLDVRRRVLGPGHPHTLGTGRNLASLDSIRSVSTSIVPFVPRTLTTSRAAGSEDGVQICEPRTSSALPDPHLEAPPAKRARQ
jgi:hypothetical protein